MPKRKKGIILNYLGKEAESHSTKKINEMNTSKKLPTYKERQKKKKAEEKAQHKAESTKKWNECCRHNIQEWGCGCHWGCPHCHITHICKNCGESFRRGNFPFLEANLLGEGKPLGILGIYTVLGVWVKHNIETRNGKSEKYYPAP